MREEVEEGATRMALAILEGSSQELSLQSALNRCQICQDREKERKKERERERDNEKEKERERQRGRERCQIC